MTKLKKLTDFLDRLDAADIHYAMSSVREGAVLVTASTGDHRWEVEFMTDGDVEVEVFKSDGEIHGEEVLDDLFEQHAATAAD